jgi:putative PIN family toxin of toxin-antitoxin system
VLKAVIDINLFVSSIINKRGTPARLFQAWRDRAFILILSEGMLEDIGRVLQYSRIKYKYHLHDSEINQALDIIKKFAIVLPDLLDLHVITQDPDDNKVLACAVSAEAHYIVSGDDHLLHLQEYKNISIVTAKDFLDIIESNNA